MSCHIVPKFFCQLQLFFHCEPPSDIGDRLRLISASHLAPWILQVMRSEKMIHQHYSVLTIHIYILYVYYIYMIIYVFNSIPCRYIHTHDISHKYIYIYMGFCGIILSKCHRHLRVTSWPRAWTVPIGQSDVWNLGETATGTQWWFAQHVMCGRQTKVNVCPHRSMTTEVTT